MIVFKQTGDFKNTKKFLEKVTSRRYLAILDKYGRQGVTALSNATPVDTGKTAASWSYEVTTDKGGVAVVWKNDNIYRGVSIALILQTGHATRSGAFIEGRDYINPAIRPIFDSMARELWREVTE